ncbi:MAG TPA: Tn3 family transposase [Acetobacteraceae bacterium]|nr:Tn3 family transposase [Acetobacteraceae bacterium]
MSTDDDLERARPRRPSLLPADPSEDDLARHWTLTSDDLAEIAQCRGADHRRRFALQLCTLRAYGRFLDDYRQAPLKIVSHLSRQLDLPPVLFLDPPSRGQTERAQSLRIRRYLGLRSFDRAVAADLRDWLRQGALEGRSTAELLSRAEHKLREWRVMLPAVSTLERIAVAEVTYATTNLFEVVTGRLPTSLRASIDLLVEVPEGDARSGLFRLKDYPKSANAAVIKSDIVRLRLIEELLGTGGELDELDPKVVRQLGELGRRYDAGDLRRFAKPKRVALVACYLVEARKTLLDQIVEMNDLFLTAMNRKSRTAVEKRRKAMRRRARDGLHRMLGGVDALAEADAEQTVGAFRDAVNAPALVEAAEACRAFERLEERGHLDAMLSRYGTPRQYLPSFLTLPFQAAAGSEPLLQAIDILRALDAGTRGPLTPADPHSFVQADWRPYLIADGKLDRHIWEISLAFAVREALCAGSLFLAQSRDHVSFWSLVHDDRSWQVGRAQAYQDLGLPTDPQEFLAKITASFDQAARAAADGLARNRFAAVHDGRLKLKRTDALPISPELRQLRQAFQASYPRVRIEDLLQDVNEWCGFTRAFQPLAGYQSRAKDHQRSLLATLIAHGTNLGLAAMSQSVDTVTAEALQDTSRWFLREATLKAANTILVDYHHSLPFSRIWGDGSRSSSDGQRFAVQRDSLLSSFYPRYFGYYDRALALYTHTSDLHSVYATLAISCAPREARYVLSGILGNDTTLVIREHTTDTHGFTEHLFGLCVLLGIAFLPRLKDLPDQVLSRIDRTADYGPLQPLLRGTIDISIIIEQWDQLVRLVASLKARMAPAHVVMQRLANAPAADRLANALTQLGRLIKTIHILRYIHEEPLRQAIQLQLNRGEFRHILARWIFFANQGDFRTGDYEEIMNKASCLSLLSNAVLIWNTVHMSRIAEQLRAGGHPVRDEDLARVSPLAHAHTIPSGTYFQSPRRRADIAPEPVTA